MHGVFIEPLTVTPIFSYTKTHKCTSLSIFYGKNHTFRKYHNMKNPIVTVEQGQLKGTTSVDYHGGTFYSFLNIPYAKAPIGDLRFKAPMRAEAWNGIKDATKNGPACPSLHMYFGYCIGKEDNCLNLNVYTKKVKSLPIVNTEKKPVMVWIHGGAYIVGSNSKDLYGPKLLMTQDIVLVSINYRLGIFGFLCLEDKSLHVPGNGGLKDQTLALKWIQENISCFGGDPSNVTIFGESAGAASSHYLMLSPLTKGLFHKAIMQSGCSLNLWARGIRNAKAVADVMKYKYISDKELLEKLQGASAKNIVRAQTRIVNEFRGQSICPWAPVIEVSSEEAFLTEDPLNILKSGKYNKIPVIMGYNSLEGMIIEVIRKLTSYKLPDTLEIEIPYDLNISDSQQSKKLAEKMKTFYFNGEKATEKNIYCTHVLVSDVQFLHSIQRAIRMQKSTGQPIYVYRNALHGRLNFLKRFCVGKYTKITLLIYFLIKTFNNTPIGSLFRSIVQKLPLLEEEGVPHSDGLYYQFNNFLTPKITIGSKEDLYIQRFVKLWTNFAIQGDPTPQNDEILCGVAWKPINSEKIEPILEIGEELKLTSNVEATRVQFWENVYKEHSQ